MTYTQTDPRWAGIPINGTQYRMGPYGCLTTINAQAFFLAGWTSVTPGTLAQEPSNYQGPLWSWYGVSKAHPQYRVHMDGAGEYRFVQVNATFSGKEYEHWVLLHEGLYTDPLTGAILADLPAAYRATGIVRSADIDRPPAPVPEAATASAVTVPVHIEGHVTAPQGVLVRTTPDTKNLSLRPMKQGEGFFYLRAVPGESIGGYSDWLLLEDGHYCWAHNTDYNPNQNA